MKPSRLLLLALVFLVCNVPQPAAAQFGGLFGSNSDVETLDVQQMKALLTGQEKKKEKAEVDGKDEPEPDFVLVDVRSPAEVNVSVIPGAITKEQFEKNRDDYEDRTVIAYCTVGGRSQRYAEKLSEQGVKVKNFKPSILGWVQAELPLVTLEGEPTNKVHIYSDRYSVPKKYQKIAN